MRARDFLVDELVDAILDGAAIDWTALDPDGQARSIIRELKVLAAVGEHRLDGSTNHATLLPVPPLRREPSADGVPALWGHLRLIERIGRGSFGDVYRAWDTRLDREVALKLLPAEQADGAAASTLIQEGKLLARVRHPNVVTIYGAERIAAHVGLWMEFVRGRTLEQTLRDRSVLGAGETIGIGIELCRAIAAMHGVGVLHRDIKTQNVISADDGRVLLMDFGTGRELDDDRSSDLAGTPLYLAPEVLEGRPASVRSDIYSLGVLLYRLLTGAYPVAGRTVLDIRRAHERGEHTALRTLRREVPRGLARVIARATDPRPDRRFQSAGELAAALERLVTRARVARRAYVTAALVALLAAAGSGWHAARGSGVTWLSALVTGPPRVAGGPIVVVPTAEPGTDTGTERLYEPVIDEIIRSLAFHGLEVRSRASSLAVQGRTREGRQSAQQLGASLIVEVAMQRRGDQVRTTARLVPAASGVPTEIDTFDGAPDLFAIQDRISRRVVGWLGLRYRESRRRPGTNLDAYEAYLRALALVERRGFINGRQAGELLSEAIGRDPHFAAAHAGLALAYVFRSFPFRGISFAEAYPIMQAAAQEAVRLEPDLAEAHVAMGWVHAYEHEWVKSEREFRLAIARNPSLTLAYTSFSLAVLQPLQRYDEALEVLRTAARHDPLSLDVRREIGEVQLFSGSYAAAADTFGRVRALEPEYPFIPYYEARALMFSGRASEAFPLLERTHPYMVSAYVQSGRHRAAERLAASQEWEPAYARTVVAAALGHFEQAIHELEQGAGVEPHRLGRLLLEPELAAVRDDPRVRLLRKRFGLP